MALSFYIKKTYVDNAPDIELVNIHYTWTPLGQSPDWETHRETRAMPRGGVLVRGMGGTTLDETGGLVRTASEQIELPDDGIRRKVLRLPNSILDPPPDSTQKVHLPSLLRNLPGRQARAESALHQRNCQQRGGVHRLHGHPGRDVHLLDHL